ncbi:hypothetical protein D9M70_535720 [compost metagenome]
MLGADLLDIPVDHVFGVVGGQGRTDSPGGHVCPARAAIDCRIVGQEEGAARLQDLAQHRLRLLVDAVAGAVDVLAHVFQQRRNLQGRSDPENGADQALLGASGGVVEDRALDVGVVARLVQVRLIRGIGLGQVLLALRLDLLRTGADVAHHGPTPAHGLLVLLALIGDVESGH